MNTIKETYGEYIKAVAAGKAAQDGKIPHIGTLQEYISKEALGDLSLPQSSFLNLDFNEGETLSASRFNELAKHIGNDVLIAYISLQRQLQKAANICSSLKSQDEALRNRALELSNQLSGLLAIYHSGEAESIIVNDISSDKDIDISVTDAEINIQAHTISSPSEKSPWPLVGNLKFSVTDPTNVLSVSSNSTIENLTLDGTESWRTEVLAADPTLPVGIELQLEISEIGASVSAVSLSSPDKPGFITASIETSINGIDFSPIINSATLTGSIFFFEPRMARFIKLRLIKSVADSILTDGRGLFVFELKKLGVFWVNPERRETFSTLQTKSLSPIGLNQFVSASLDVCETIPENSNIIYKLSFGRDGEFSPWEEVLPASRSGISFDAAVATIPGAMASSVSNGFTATRSSHVYCDLDPANYILGQSGTSLLVPASAIRARSQLLLWRNTKLSGNISYKYDNVAPGGWMLKDGFYQTWINIIRQTSLRIDNNQGILIDGRSQSGNVILDKGAHLFQIKESQWDTNTQYKRSIEELISLGNGNIQAAMIAWLVSESEFLYETNNDDYSKFCIGSVGNGDGIFVKSALSLSESEFFAISYNNLVSANAADSIKLKAEFITDGKAIPMLSGFKIKVSR